MPQPTQAQLGARLNPTATTLPTMSDRQVFRTDSGGLYVRQGNNVYSATIGNIGLLNGGGVQNGINYLKNTYGIDYNAIPTVDNSTLGDMFPNTGTLNHISLIGNTGAITDPSKLALFAPSGVTAGTQTVNATPNTLDPNAIAASTAAQTGQLAPFQNKNVTIGTSPEGVSGYTATPLGSPTAPGGTLEALKQQLLGAQNTLTGMGAPPAYSAPTTLSSSSLSGGTTQNFQQGPTLPGYSVTAGLDTTPQLQATPQEQKQSTLADQIAQLNTQESGKAQYQNEQNSAQGVQAKQQLVNDFSQQLKVTQLEAANIQQTTQTGEGVTSAIDQRQRAEALRLNNVKSLGIYAQMQMAQGNLSTAQDAANKAVSLKYDPIEAQLAAAKANLDLIKNDPETKREDQNRAMKAQTQLDAQTAAIAKQKDDATKIWDIYFNAATQGMTDVTKLNAIKNASSPEAALQIAGQYGAKGSTAQPTTSIQEYQFAVSQGYKGSYSDYQNEDANRKAKVAAGGNGLLAGLTANQISTTVNQIAGSFDNEPIVKQFNVLNEGYQFAQSLPNTTTNPADDQGLIYAFAKAMDPGSVVREGEYATVQKYSQSWINSFGKSVNQAISGTGFLSEAARASIKQTIFQKYQASKTNYDNVYSQYQQRINAAKAGNLNSITDYSKAYGAAGAGGTSSTNPLGI